MTNLGLTLGSRVRVTGTRTLPRPSVASCAAPPDHPPRKTTRPLSGPKSNSRHQFANVLAARAASGRERNLDRAIQAETRVLEVITPEMSPEVWAGAMNNLGMYYLTGGDRGDRAKSVARALDAFTHALKVRTVEAFPSDHLQTQRSMGNILFDEGCWGEAADRYRGALNAHEVLLSLAGSPEARLHELQQVRDLPDKLAYALARVERFEEAVLVAERGRARDLAESLQLDQAPVSQLRPEDRRRFEEARSLVLSLQARSRGSRGARPRDDFPFDVCSPLRRSACARRGGRVDPVLRPLVPSAADCRRSPFRQRTPPRGVSDRDQGGQPGTDRPAWGTDRVRRRLDDRGGVTPRSATGARLLREILALEDCPSIDAEVAGGLAGQSRRTDRMALASSYGPTCGGTHARVSRPRGSNRLARDAAAPCSLEGGPCRPHGPAVRS